MLQQNKYTMQASASARGTTLKAVRYCAPFSKRCLSLAARPRGQQPAFWNLGSIRRNGLRESMPIITAVQQEQLQFPPAEDEETEVLRAAGKEEKVGDDSLAVLEDMAKFIVADLKRFVDTGVRA